MFENTFSGDIAAPNVDPMTLKDVFKKGWDWTKSNKAAAFGTGLLGAANLGGLFDNDKLLGQGVGAVAGAVAPYLFTKFTGIPLNIGKLGRVNLAMGGGALGSLFDVLRSKKAKEQEAARMQQTQSTGGKYAK